MDNYIAFWEQQSKKMILRCKIQAQNGIFLYTPDGEGHYPALWTRDFAYMVENAAFIIPTSEIINCIDYLIDHRREDGWIPDRVAADGTGIYVAGNPDMPIGEPNIDNAPFLIMIVYHLSKLIAEDEFLPLFVRWEPHLYRGLELIPQNEEGLVYSDPSAPHSPYGFTDTVAKTGALFMESLLWWNAARCMTKLCIKYQLSCRGYYEESCKNIELAITSLYREKTGLYHAATIDCDQADIWANAYMLYIGFPCPESHRENILEYLGENYESYVYEGHIRHLPSGEYWDRMLSPVNREEYQNGAYWATASGWVMWCLYQKYPEKAARIIRDVTNYCRNNGCYECINKGYQQLDNYVASATNVYGGIKRILDLDPDFLKNI